MEKIHETQSTEVFHEKDELYTPIEDLQKITTGGVYKNSSFQLGKLPKWIRYIGYVLIGFLVLTVILGFILSLVSH